jgi:hypothetical protein
MATATLLEAPLRTDVVQRVRAAYRAQPTLSLTLLQARRLFDLDLATAEGVLLELVAEQFLCETPQAQFIRLEG